MDKKILDHYLEYSQFTYPGLYETYLDEFVKIMQKPDKNFDELFKIWNTNKKFRILKGGLL